nr:hypothetical protein [uncultured Carboxylicivirga sp.]
MELVASFFKLLCYYQNGFTPRGGNITRISILVINLTLIIFANVRSKLLEWFGRKYIIYLVANLPVSYIVNLILQILEFPQKDFIATLILAFFRYNDFYIIAIFKPENRFRLFKSVAIPEN